jgi:hypothetical protein
MHLVDLVSPSHKPSSEAGCTLYILHDHQHHAIVEEPFQFAHRNMQILCHLQEAFFLDLGSPYGILR